MIVGVNVYFFLEAKSVTNYFFTVDTGNRLSVPNTTTKAVEKRFVETSCKADSDCSWEITNCCAQEAGGKWDCINGKTFVPGCLDNILCPDIVSPEPTTKCGCVQGECVSS